MAYQPYQQIIQQIEDLTPKQKAELRFWDYEVNNYVLWYKGITQYLYQTPCPSKAQQIQKDNYRKSAILTWTELHQKPKYLHDLNLPSDSFKNMKVLDIRIRSYSECHMFRRMRIICSWPSQCFIRITWIPP